MSDYTAEHNFAVNLVHECGKISMRYFMADFSIDYKNDGSPVTEADRACEEHIRERIEAAYPEHGIIGEEGKSLRTDAEYLWVIDPIDGTKSFLAGVPLYSTLIALLHNNKPVVGVAYFPALNELITAIDGRTTFWNGRAARVRETAAAIADAWVMTSACSLEDPEQNRLLQTLISRAKLARTWGDAYAYNLLATGRCDLAFDLKMRLWDLAALIPIFKGAGIHFCNAAGNDPLAEGIAENRNYSCIAAATPRLQKAVLALWSREESAG